MKKWISLAVIFSVFSLSSCSSNYFVQKNNNFSNATQAQEEKASSHHPAGQYAEFQDILVPEPMKIQPKKSLSFETGNNVQVGVLVYEGKAEPRSLFQFFLNNMPNRNWRLVSYLKYGRYMAVFEKGDKICTIYLEENPFNTLLNIWVTPLLHKSSQNSSEADLN